MQFLSTKPAEAKRACGLVLLALGLLSAGAVSSAEPKVWKLAELTQFDALPVSELTGPGPVSLPNTDAMEVGPQMPAAPSVAFKLNDLINSQSINFGQLIRGDLRPTSVRREREVGADSLSLKIHVGEDKLRFSPSRLEMDAAGTEVSIKLLTSQGKEAKISNSELRLFVRDASIAAFDKGFSRLIAKNSGRTEVYVLNGDKMFIVPVSVGGDSGTRDSIKVPNELVSLDGFIADNSLRSASIGMGAAPGTENRSETEDASDELATEVADEAIGADELRAPALADQSESQSSGMLALGLRSTPREGRYRDVRLQIVDERSTTDRSRSYPVANARITVVGVGEIGRTDARGVVTVQDVPRAGTIALIVDQEDGLIVPQLAVISADGDAEDRRISVTRESFFDLATRAAGVTQLNFKSSLCLNLRDARNGMSPLRNIQVRLDQEAEGPFYFNQFGLVDSRLGASGSDGRACFFNVEPGVTTVTAFYQGQAVATGLTALVAATHREDDFDLFGSVELKAQIAALTTSHEQLGSDGSLNDSLRRVDFLNLSFAGESEFFAAIDSGELGFDGEVNFLNDRAVIFGQDGDFELTSYSVSRGDIDQPMNLPLVPRGFVEDMAVYADVPYDPNLGAIMVQFYGAPAGSDIRFRAVPLVVGRESIDAWIYDQYPVSKGLFFNLEPGAYAVITETSEGHWLNYQVVEVYSETLSFTHNRESLSGFRALQP